MSETETPSRRAQRRDSKRHAILQAACRVFLASGFGGASMDQVAAAAGASKMTVYRHFRSKEELFSGVVEEMCDAIMDADVSRAMEGLPPRRALHLFGVRMLRTVFSRETLGLHAIVIAENGRFPHIGRLFYNSGPGASMALLSSYLRRHRTHPDLRISDPVQDAEDFMAVLRGYDHMRALLGVQRSPSSRAIEARVRRAVRHLAPQR
jgi:TetR/AcrR family transcriptional repressor of mexJK operon